MRKWLSTALRWAFHSHACAVRRRAGARATAMDEHGLESLFGEEPGEANGLRAPLVLLSVGPLSIPGVGG